MPLGGAVALATEVYVRTYKWMDNLFNYVFIKPSTMPLYEPDLPFEEATFGMGCFWKPESMFGCSKGVLRTRVGFAGGAKKDPTYRSLGDHTEATRVEYDPKVTNFKELLDLFWAHHNPTKDSSTTQYMSAIFYHDDAQRKAAEDSLKTAQKGFRAPVVTKILKLEIFYDAEEYHQKYRLQRQTALYKSLQDSGMKDVTKSHAATRLNGYVGGFGTMEAFEAEWQQLGLSSEQANAVRALIRKGGSK